MMMCMDEFFHCGAKITAHHILPKKNYLLAKTNTCLFINLSNFPIQIKSHEKSNYPGFRFVVLPFLFELLFTNQKMETGVER